MSVEATTTDDPGMSVIKLGGSCVEDMSPVWWDDLADHLRDRSAVLVHGWSKAMRQSRTADGPEFLRDRFGNRSRWTTPEVIEHILAVSATVTAAIAAELGRRGVSTRRVLGCDGLIAAGEGERWWWRGKELVELDNLVGPIVKVDVSRLGPEPICHLVTPLARNPAGQVVNTDADRAAAAISGHTGAEALVLVTDVPNLIVDGAPVSSIGAADAKEFRDHGAVGGMRKKLRAATEAVDGGVGRVVFGNDLVSRMLAEKAGTVITG